MVRDPLANEGRPELIDVLDALDDPDCRDIIERLDQPMTASQISDECGVPLSTTYRKLDLLSNASLVEERARLRRDGHHIKHYVVAFDAVHIALDVDEPSLEAEIIRLPGTPDEQLAQLWSEVREET